MELKAVRGMHDLFGDELARWRQVETRVREVFAAFGYEEIRTPVLEKQEVFTHTVGDDTDIVEKQMYSVMNDSEKLVLRPEGTAAFMRAIIEHGLHRTGHPGRYYYYQAMFRHERPQKGRLRQFHQFGAELINDGSPEADAELIALLAATYSAFDVTEYEIRVNSVGCNDCRPGYRDVLKAYFQPHLEKLCPQCQKRFERAPMRILDCKAEACKAIAADAPRMLAHLCEVCDKHHRTLKVRLDDAGLKYIEDTNIVRGLDYYSRTAFEFTSNLLGAQSALCGGGRYDGMSTRFGEKPFPAVGYGLGMERLMLVLEAKQAALPPLPKPQYFFAPLGEEAYQSLFRLSLSVKRKGIAAVMAYEKDKGLKWLMKQADRHGTRFTVILGENEIKQNQATIKNMGDGTQETVELARLEEILIRRAQGAN